MFWTNVWRKKGVEGQKYGKKKWEQLLGSFKGK